MINATISHYRITAELGRGGMGIVYQAMDTKLNRQVALKVLPAAALASEDDRARFFREAQAAAQLHHPNIATVFEIDEGIPTDESGAEIGSSDGPRPFIVMEFIEGQTLAEYIKAAPLKLTEAVQIAAQVAEALKAAHAKEIVHRDIKSANVMLTKDGVAKVLDFGLAKTNQSTMLTRMGSTLGTVAYMSPEQARGQEVDSRSDLYSLGTMLYEMVAGQLPFGGDYEQAILYGILNETPEPLTARRTGVPMGLEWIVNKLLAKEPRHRYQTAADLVADLETVDLSGSGHSRRSMSAATGAMSTVGLTPIVESSTGTSAGLPVWVWGGLVTAIVLGLAGGWFLKPNPTAAPPPIRKLDVSINRLIAQDPSVSWDGRYWAFETADTVGFTGVTIVDVQDGSYYTAQESEGYASPRFSPDSRWLLAGNGTDIVSILVPDGRPIPLPETGSDFTWIDNNTVGIIQDGNILTLLELDTQATRKISIGALDSTITNIDFPAYIPGTEQVLLTLDFAGEISNVAVFDLQTETLTTLVRNACCAKSVRDKVIAYHIGNRVGQVVAQRYDAGAKSLNGSPVDIIGSQVLRSTWTTGHDDSFLYLVGAAFDETEIFSILNPETLQSRDTQMEPANYDRVSFSPDGGLIAAERQIGTGGQSKYIVVYNAASGVEQRLTYRFDESRAPTWSPNGKIYYSAGPAQNSDIYSKNADGTGPEELVVEDGDYAHASRDGKWLAYASGSVLKAMNLETGEITVVDSTFSRQGDPKISPDGRYIAFTADNQTSSFTSGGQRLFVRSFPEPTRFYEKVTETYADDPEWAADGSALYFRNRGQVSRMEVDISGIFTKRGSPRLIHTYPGVNVRLAVNPVSGELLSVHPLSDTEAGSNARFILIESFTAYLERLFDR